MSGAVGKPFSVGLGLLCALIGVLVFASAPALAVVEHGEHTVGAPFGGSGSGNGEFSSLAGVATDEATGDVYVVDSGNNRVEQFAFNSATKTYEFVDQFNGSGTFLNENSMSLPPEPLSEPEGIAVDNDPSSPSYQDVYVADPDVADPSASVIDKFGPTGDYKGQITGAVGGSLEHLKGIAVGASGVLWVYRNNENAEVNEIESYSDEEPNTFVSTHELPFESLVPGIAVASEKNSEDKLEDYLYVVTKASEVDKLNSEGTVLVKEFCSQKSVSGIAVESSSNDLYVDDGSEVVRCSPSGKVIESENMPVAGFGTVAVNSSNGYVYATNAAAHGVDVFPPFAGAGIHEEQASSVESSTEGSGATLEAQIDPNAYDHTTYHFEYDTTAYTSSEPHDESTPKVEIPTGTSPVAVSARVKQLQPSTTYYYRAVLESEVNGQTVTVTGANEAFTTPAAPGSEPQSCPNEQRRAEQPFGLTLPGCRAYEMVSPEETGGQDATDSFEDPNARASEAKEEEPAITYASKGSFGAPTGAAVLNQFVSRREPANDRWVTQAVTPLWNSQNTNNAESFETTAFEPELKAGIARTDASLPGAGAPSFGADEYGLYVSDFAAGSYRYVAQEKAPLGTSTDLSHIVFGVLDGGGETISEWVEGAVVPVSVTNNDASLQASVGSAPRTYNDVGHDLWHAVSAGGSRVYFTSPDAEEEDGRSEPPGALYLRVNAEQKQSKLASPEAGGTGTLTAGLDEVTALAVATGELTNTLGGSLPSGSTLYPFTTASGKFHVGQQVSGDGIAPGTKITQIATGCYGSSENECLTLSEPTTEEIGNNGGEHAKIFADGPEPFEIGQKISGDGIPAGTTITKAVPGKLTLSELATTSITGEALHAGGECTVTTDACTVEVSPAGATGARYWGASADGTKVFFTREGNLYEYSLPVGQTEGQTTALTEAGEVQGVVQISEKGSYVYFVAKSALKGERGETLRNASGVEPVAGADNLYVSDEGGAPAFITTLAAGDESDWHGAQAPAASGPQINTAVVNPSGSRLAFLSERSLPTANFPTGYDNKQAQRGECEGEIEGTDSAAFSETGACHEIYLYDAETRGLVCASCDPTGARPLGPAGFGPPAKEFALYRRRNLLEDGTLFFDSSDALVPHASDGRRNVYEYAKGHVDAISNVAGGDESFFLDADPSGEDVFFASANKLLPQDTGDNVVVWDARKDGGFPVAVAAPPCTTAEACRAASGGRESNQSVFGAPPSATFSGPGNLTPPVVKPAVKPKTLTRAQKLAAALKSCKKDKKKSKRQTCEKQARDKYGSVKKKAKKSASNNQRTKS